MTKTEEKKHEPEQLRKMFIGGLDYGTTDDGLKNYYEQWGTVVDVVVMKDPKTRRSRGFGFITYSEASMVDDAMRNRPHKIDGRQVEPKRAVPRDLCGKGEANVRKLFIGGIGKLVKKEDLEEYFGKFGTLTDCAIVVTKDTGEPRGFGFVEYDDVDSADKVILIRDHEIKGRRVEIKKAIARDDMNKNDSKSDRSRGRGFQDGRGGGDFRNGQGNFGGGWNSQGGNWNQSNNSPWSNQSPQMGNWGGNQAWGNNPCWGNNQNGFPQGFNNMGLGNMGGGGSGMGGNMGNNMGNMGGGGGMGGNMGGGMGNMGGRMGNMGSGMGNMGGGMGNMGGGMGNMGSGMGGNMNMGMGMGMGMGMNNMGGDMGSGLGGGGGGMGGLGCGMGGMLGGMGGGGGGGGGGVNNTPNNMYGGGNMGGMPFNNNYGGGSSGGGPIRGSYGSSGNRPSPYSTSGGGGGMMDRRGGGGQYSNFNADKGAVRRDGKKPIRC